MRLLCIFVALLPLVAQTPVPPTAPAAPVAKPEVSPVPTAESWLTGSVDLGYRWQTGVGAVSIPIAAS